MTTVDHRIKTADASPDSAPTPANYTGAVYGSLLTSSTILGGTAALGDGVIGDDLLVTLVVTSAVLWLFHVYARVVGESPRGQGALVAASRAAARRELPVLVAVVPAVVVVAIALAVEDSGQWAATAGFAAAIGTRSVPPGSRCGARRAPGWWRSSACSATWRSGACSWSSRS